MLDLRKKVYAAFKSRGEAWDGLRLVVFGSGRFKAKIFRGEFPMLDGDDRRLNDILTEGEREEEV